MGDDITIGVTEIVNNIEVTAQPNDQVIDISVVDNSDEVTLNVTPNVVEVNINKGSSFARWGTIYGNLTDQTDLTDVLLSKADLVNGLVPAYQLPSFVDDVIEVANFAALPAVGETGKLYLTLDNNKIYRWSGSIYIEIASNNAIWGAITGTLSNQTDLQTALNAKANDNAVVKLTGDQSITGIKTFTTVSGNALTVNNSTNEWGQVINNNSGGIGLDISNLGNGTALVLRSKNTSTGDIITHQGIDGLVKFNLSSTGNVAANSFIKSGGTATQILAANGSVITAGTNITISGGVISASGGGSTDPLQFNTTDRTVWNRGKGNIVSNTSFGEGAFKNNISGGSNSAFALGSLQFNESGTNNSAFGEFSMQGNVSGSFSSAFGKDALISSNGSYNTAIGYRAGKFLANGLTAILNPNQSIFIGSDTKSFAANQTNEIVIGHNATGHGSNSVTLGNSSIVTTILRGNVGIGTTNPTRRLDVVGLSIFNGTQVRSTDDGSTVVGFFGNMSGWTGGTLNNDLAIGSYTSNIAFFTNNSVTERMRITSGGAVLVGTTADNGGKLTVSGGQGGGFRVEQNGGAISLPSTGLSFSTGYSVGYIRNANGLGSVVDLYIEAARVSFSNLGTGLVYSSSGFLTSTNPSDSRLKDNITDLQYGLNEILKLRPVSYNWKNDNINQGKQFGFIAQEVQEVMPELVKEFETEDGERLGLDKEGIYAALVNSIKELKAEIELLKQK